MEITAKQVAELKKITDAGMMDCKKALTECNGDIDKAVDWLREKGIARASKKAERIAAEGLCAYAINKNSAYVYELNSETDFAAKSEKFNTLMTEICNIIVKEDCDTVEKVLTNGGEELIVAATSIIGEKISLRRVEKLTKTDSQTFGVYSHNGGKIVVLTVIDGNDELVAKDICMHVAMYSPKYLNEAEIEASEIAHETEVIKSEIVNDPINEGKSAEIIEKMVMGRLSKFKKEICLIDQAFIKDPSLSVKQYLKNNNSNAIKYVRYEVGEGMQKRCEDFAAEVAAQTKM